MPRSRLAGPSPLHDNQPQPDYFDSLKALAEYTSKRSVARSEPNRVPLAPARADVESGRGRLVVCHDYKGGYSEDPLERGYTFNFWHLCDTYIYFSHHRVSLPPAAVVRTAHRHGTRVLGTLIFEWDAGRDDIIELVDPGRTAETTKFDKLSFAYADALVQLASERGIDGWLVNIEVDLGGQRGLGIGRNGARDHARLLLAWLRYFKAKMHERVPGSEVMWYDAVTTAGSLSWQNALNERNLPFLSACDSIFLNYFWTPNRFASTVALAKQIPTLRMSQIHFGIDMFGRGSYGGGGFETWRAIEAVRQCDAGLSIALFAPGWTAESESLEHSLATQEKCARWFDDDMYLWSNGPPTSSVPKELARMRKVRRDQAGAHRARQLADALDRNLRIPISFRAPIEPLEFDLSSIPDPPGSFRPISHFFAPARVAPSLNGAFYTNFSSGSGHSFYLCGKETNRSDTGWTNIDYTFPFPSLLFTRPNKGVTVSFTEEPGSVWEGERAIKVEANKALCSATFDIVDLDLAIPRNTPYYATIIWKSLESLDAPDDPKYLDSAISPIPTLFVADPTGRTQGTRLEKTTLKERNAGSGVDRWRSTTSEFTLDAATRITRFSLEQKRPSSFVIGSISIVPAPTRDQGRSVISALSYTKATSSLGWTTSLSFSTPVSHDRGTDSWYTSQPPIPTFLQYHVYRRRPREVKDEIGPSEDQYLGTTREPRFAVRDDVVSGYEVMIRGVEADGTVMEYRTVV